MTQDTDRIFMHGSSIAEAKMRQARRTQSYEVKRMFTELFRWLFGAGRNDALSGTASNEVGS